MLTFYFTRPPNRNQVGGELLDHNYSNTMAENKNTLTKHAKLYGLSFMSDGATISRNPFSNVLSMSGDVPPTPVAVIDATEHMANGGKKDASYVARYMEEHILKLDPQKLFTILFLFDGAGNVQKGGEILEAIFPRATTIHGGEHVISLFFDDLSKLPQIKVCYFILHAISSSLDSQIN